MVLRQGERYLFLVRCRNAQQVYLVGDFNEWSTTATPMEANADSMWRVELELPSGTYRFGYFAINAAWFSDEATTGATSMRGDSESSTLTVTNEVLN